MEHPPGCQCFLHRVLLTNSSRGAISMIEQYMLDVVLAEFPEVQHRRRFGRYEIDAYLPPPYHLAFEADGLVWHDTARDARRDAYLLERYDLPVVHLGEEELRILMGKPLGDRAVAYAAAARERMRRARERNGR
jgi:hypothetical protein